VPVSVALGHVPLGSCAVGDGNDDGRITVDEIIVAASRALDGCVGAAADGYQGERRQQQNGRESFP